MATLVEKVTRPAPVERVVVEYRRASDGDRRVCEAHATPVTDGRDCEVRIVCPVRGPCADTLADGHVQPTRMSFSRQSAEAMVLALTEFYGLGK